jgi:uncharacterized membrane protein YbjE (DUF340 family)
MQTIPYLLALLASLCAGAIFSRLIGHNKLHAAVSRAMSVLLWVLLFSMGLNTSHVPDLAGQIARIGFEAALSAVLVVCGCLLIAWLLMLAIPSCRIARKQSIQDSRGIGRLGTPLLLVTIVLLGMAGGLATPWFRWFSSDFIAPMLYMLLFLVGMQMVQHRVDLKPLLGSPLLLLVPLSTVAGTLLGGALLPLFTSRTLGESLALVSGFGWYTLSGVLLSDLGSPDLGAVSFLSNLLRESLAFVLIPTLASLSVSAVGAISVSGATSMDVTLPLIQKSYGEAVVPLAQVHGSIISLLAPFAIPLWYRLGQ